MTPAEHVAALTVEQVNEEIAKRRGWSGPDEFVLWNLDLAAAAPADRAYYDAKIENGDGARWELQGAPPYCGDWSLAGPLLEELAVGSASPHLYVDELMGAWTCKADNALGGPFVPMVTSGRPTESIARVWLIVHWSKE